MATSLDLIVSHYLQDKSYQQEHQEMTRSRDESIAFYKSIIQRFTNNKAPLASLRAELNALNKDRFWRANGTGFLLEIRKLDSNHSPSKPELSTMIRMLLDGLNAQNVGRRIEQWSLLMFEEGERMLKLGMHPSLRAAPANSSFIVSLLALWLDRAAEPSIYHHDLRLGLASLVNAHLLPSVADARIDAGGIVIVTEADHYITQHLLRTVGRTSS